MRLNDRRDFLRATAAASTLSALGARAAPVPTDPSGVEWQRKVCPCCVAGCSLLVGATDGKVFAVKLDPGRHATGFCSKAFLLQQLADGGASMVAGVLFVTAQGGGPRVAATLIREPNLDLTGGDGDSRLAAVWEALGDETLDAAVQRLLHADPELLGVYATFVGFNEEP